MARAGTSLSRLAFAAALAAAVACPLRARAENEAPRPNQPTYDQTIAAQAQLPEALGRALEGITEEQAMAHVKVLCDPALAGRRSGENGARLAADYLADQFRKMGLRPGGQAGSYFQTFKIRAGYLIDSELVVKTVRATSDQPAADASQLQAVDAPMQHVVRRDFMPVHLAGDRVDLDVPIAFAGFGVKSDTAKLDEYADLDVTGAAVLVVAGVPWDASAASVFRRSDRTAYDSLSHKARTAADHGAKALLVVDMPTKWRRTRTRADLRLPDLAAPIDSPIPVFHIAPDVAADLTGTKLEDLVKTADGIRASRKPASRRLDDRTVHMTAQIAGEAVIGRNVVAVLPGSDAKLRHEAVVVGAHFDHLGERPSGIHPGANDNASGVAAMLSVARAAASLPIKPRRTLIFVAFGAEEIGRLGSARYVERPAVALERTSLMINFDMVGRNGANDLYAVGTHSSKELHELHQLANGYVGLKLTHPESFRLGRSDHTAFYYGGVPVMYLFGGLHVGYHTADDRPELLEPAKIVGAAKLALLTALVAADRDDRFKVEALPPEHPFLQKPRRLPLSPQF